MDAEVKSLIWLWLLSILLIACQSGPVTVTETTPTAFTTPSMTVSEELAMKPLPRSNHAMAYDSKRHVVVLFGGWSNKGELLDDTWEYDGTAWQKIATTTSPPARADLSLAYDPERGITMLFGGITSDSAYTSDVWFYDGQTWQQTEPSHHPPPRHSAPLVYDPVEQAMLLFGGYGSGGQLHDTWKFNGTTWQEMEFLSAGPPITLPQMVYDSRREVFVLRSVFNVTTFEYDRSTWSHAPLEPEKELRIPILGFRMVYDIDRGLTVLFGGEAPAGQDGVWEYDGEKWYQPPSVDARPSSRLYHAMVYDEARGVVVLFGGFAADETYLNDTWEYDGVTWTQK